MKCIVEILFSLAVSGFALPAKFEPALVRDNTGHMHLVNPDPYSVVDAELEPFFDAKTDVIFRLYTRQNQDFPDLLEWDSLSSVRYSYFNTDVPTKFTIHGWQGDGTSELHSNIRKQYFAGNEFNMISVDWGVGASTINYVSARNHVGAVGEIISQMINTIVSAVGVSRNTISLIGHSLGAHVAGKTGKLQNGQIHTIIGLDPAGPLFTLDHDDILHPSAAQYVEAVFTSAGSLGFNAPLGDANFFANGGRAQPGCGIDFIGYCAHLRSHELFAESLSTLKGFRGTKCASHAEVLIGNCTSSGTGAMMGGEPSNYGGGVHGIYWFNTNSEFPYAQG